MASVNGIPRLYKISTTGKAEDAEQYRLGGLHPVHIGDTLKDGRYRIVHKLGFGSFSTVWLGHDKNDASYVSLKITRADFPRESNELKILRYLAQQKYAHQGSQYIMKLKDDFILSGPNGDHLCYVSQVAGRRLARPEGVSYTSLGPARLLSSQLFAGVDYLHLCNIVHADLYTGNILLQLNNFDSWSDEDVYTCLGHPFQEKLHRIDGGPLGNSAPVYTVHPGNLLGLEERLLSSKVLIVDFGQAFFLDKPPRIISTPSQFSSPERLYGMPLSHPIDTWAIGCNIFEICAGYTLFKMLFNPRQDVLKDFTAMLGKPTESMWQLWDERLHYFDPDGTPIKSSEESILVKPYPLLARIQDMAWLYSPGSQIPDPTLKRDENELPTAELVDLYNLLSRIFRYAPEERITPNEGSKHPFNSFLTSKN